MSRVPASGRFLAGGVPVCLMFGFWVESAGVQVQDAPVAAVDADEAVVWGDLSATASQIVPPITSNAAIAAPVIAARARCCRPTSLMDPPAVPPRSSAATFKCRHVQVVPGQLLPRQKPCQGPGR